MTEKKRFTMCHEQNDLNGWTMSIVDWETEQPFDYTIYEVHSSSITSTKEELEDLCLLLNQLNDKNEQFRNLARDYNIPFENLCNAFEEMLNCDCATDCKNVVENYRKENEQLKNDLKRCREWINSDKYDYETALAFIKSKGYSLKDVLEYKGDVE